MIIDTRELITVAEASNRGISRLVNDALAGRGPVIVRRNKPVAAVVSIEEYDRLAEAQQDVVLLLVAIARSATDTGQRFDVEDVATGFGVPDWECDENAD